MAHSEETLKQKPTLADVMKELANINKRLDAHGAQFKAIRDGIEHNSVISERMWGDIHHIRADIREMLAEMRKDKLALK